MVEETRIYLFSQLERQYIYTRMNTKMRAGARCLFRSISSVLTKINGKDDVRVRAWRENELSTYGKEMWFSEAVQSKIQ